MLGSPNVTVLGVCRNGWPLLELYSGLTFFGLVTLPRRLRNWLLDEDADPSVRHRVLREVLDRPRYIAAIWGLLVLSALGVSGKHPRIAKAVELFFRRFSGPSGGLGYRGSEVCFTGNAVRMLVRFGYLADPRLRPAIKWLIRHQKSDGGWHCDRSRSGTLDAWEAMAAVAALPLSARSASVLRAIERGAEFYLGRGLLREGRNLYAPWLRLHYPVHYYYDILVGLDVLTALGYGGDPRIRPALDRLEGMRNRDGGL